MMRQSIWRIPALCGIKKTMVIDGIVSKKIDLGGAELKTEFPQVEVAIGDREN